MLWIVKRKSATGWDEFRGFVIRAPNEVEARNEASMGRFGQLDKRWQDNDFASCEEISLEGETCTILADFKAG